MTGCGFQNNEITPPYNYCGTQLRGFQHRNTQEYSPANFSCSCKKLLHSPFDILRVPFTPFGPWRSFKSSVTCLGISEATFSTCKGDSTKLDTTARQFLTDDYSCRKGWDSWFLALRCNTKVATSSKESNCKRSCNVIFGFSLMQLFNLFWIGSLLGFRERLPVQQSRNR